MNDSDDGCPFCWGTGRVTVMEPPPPGAPDNTASRPVTRRCPDGCEPAPYVDDQDQHLEVPF